MVSSHLLTDLKSLRFTKDHEWLRLDGSVGTVGITAKAVEALGDIVFVELSEESEQVEREAVFGLVESVKAVSDLYAPVSGTIVERNVRAIENPELVTSGPYDEGWLVKIELSQPSEVDQMMTEEQYNQFVAEE